MATKPVDLYTASPRKKRQQIEYVMEQFRIAHPDVDPAVEPHKIAEWAIKEGISRPIPQTPEEILRKDIARYLKNDYVEDPQGRHVRKNHAVFINVTTQAGVKRRHDGMRKTLRRLST